MVVKSESRRVPIDKKVRRVRILLLTPLRSEEQILLESINKPCNWNVNYWLQDHSVFTLPVNYLRISKFFKSTSYNSVCDFRKYLPGHMVLKFKSAPGRNRTCDLLLRRQLLYPTELQAHY